MIGATAAEEVKLVLGEPIPRAATEGGDTVVEPQPTEPRLIEPTSFGGEEYAGAENTDDTSGGDSLGVVAITRTEGDGAGDSLGTTSGTSYSTEFGRTDQLSVTGSPSGPGGLPIPLGTGPSGGVIVKSVQPGSQVAADSHHCIDCPRHGAGPPALP